MTVFVIKYKMSPQSYYRGANPGFPMFGGTIEQATKFTTRMEAAQAMNEFPIVACVCSEIEEVTP